MTADLKLGLMLGYWTGEDPDDATETRARRRGVRLRLGVDGRGVRVRRVHAADVDRRAHLAHQARHRARAAVGTHAGRDGDDGGDARPPLRRPAASSASASPVRRSSRAGTACRSRSRSRAPGSTSRSCARSGARGAGHQRRRALPAAVSGRRPGSASRSSRSCTRCATDIPIYLGAEGPKNVELATEIADGWLPIFFHVEHGAGGLRRGARRCARPGFEIACPVTVVVNDDVADGARVGQVDARLLHRRHGRQGQELPPRRDRAAWASARRRTRCRSCSSLATATAR